MLNDNTFWLAGSMDIVRYIYEHMPPQHLVLQQLVDDYRLSWYNNGDAGDSSYNPFTVAEQQNLPLGFHIRLSWGMQQHDIGATSLLGHHDAWTAKHCYLEHVSDEEKKGCEKLHMKPDGQMGYGFPRE